MSGHQRRTLENPLAIASTEQPMSRLIQEREFCRPSDPISYENPQDPRRARLYGTGSSLEHGVGNGGSFIGYAAAIEAVTSF